MTNFALQFGCLLVMIFFITSYMKESRKTSFPRNIYFNLLLLIAPLDIIFDGVASWTVNNQAVVSRNFILLFHCLFYVCANAVTIILFIYTVNQTVGINSRNTLIKLLIPGAISEILIISFIGNLQFIDGAVIHYSMGASVTVCYISLLFHGFSAMLILVLYRRTVEKEKLEKVVYFYLLVLVVLGTQLFILETLITALIPTLSVIGIYITFENPALIRLHRYNEEIVDKFATLVESRDDSTGGHIKRTREYVNILLKEMQKHPNYKNQMTEDYIQNVKKAAPMHDIGKISTPDKILLKNGKLEDDEYEIMKQHAATGGDIINKTYGDIGSPDFQKIVFEVARYHHEKWNGRGYPEGLKGEEIPLHARIMAIADVFDAVSAKRCYRDALPIDVCIKIIEDGSGTDFDPELVNIFMEAKDKILYYYESEKD